MARCILEVDTSDVQKKAYALAASCLNRKEKRCSTPHLSARPAHAPDHEERPAQGIRNRRNARGAGRADAKVSISNLGVNCLIPIVGNAGAQIGQHIPRDRRRARLGIHAPQVHDYGAHCQERTKQTA